LIRILSLGAGVQSSTLALMAAKGIGPIPDCAIFADTHHEPKAVYDWLDWLEPELPFPVYRVSHGDLWKSASTPRKTRDGERTYISTGIPVYLAEGLRKGIGMRQCTRTFKIEPIERKVRALLGMSRVRHNSGVLAEMLIGISTDEADRMKPSRKPWIQSRWPLIDMGMSRADCLAWMQQQGHPEPPRSACVFCPFRDDDSWLALTPEEMASAIEQEQELQAAYAKTEIRALPFFHDSRVPLSEVVFVPGSLDPRKAQLNLFRNECEGMCGV
jgi:hypothetical protein